MLKQSDAHDMGFGTDLHHAATLRLLLDEPGVILDEHGAPFLPAKKKNAKRGMAIPVVNPRDTGMSYN